VTEATVDAVIFDLDGVVVQTARVHAAAWKEVFDDFLSERARRDGSDFEPFDIDNDYRRYVDGMPRYDGVREFMKSRGIDLPEGDPSDPSTAETVQGVGNRKNAAFLDRLRTEGATPYPSTVALIDRLRPAGIKVALISASRNCKAVLESAGLEDLFDTVVDGVESEKCELAGKPAPDIFLEAARRLKADPGRSAVVEDAIAGVEAGRHGGFAPVIGIDRTGHAEELEKHGAQIIVTDLAELDLAALGFAADSDPAVPSALDNFHHIAACGTGREMAVFLDYDGTLTPIVERPDLAVLGEDARERVGRLAERIPVAVISGRDLDDIRELVALENVYYAGSHGFHVSGPGGWSESYEDAKEIPAIVPETAAELRDALREIDGVLVEPKSFAVAVHYRQANPDSVPSIEAAVDEILARYPKLKKSRGKKVFELRPALEWDKGRAVSWLLEAMGRTRNEVLPIYIGDDVTDEDAFTALKGWGIGIFVAQDAYGTAAEYALADPQEVTRFLDRLAEELER
jgi:alpha,alpha-trehalase